MHAHIIMTGKGGSGKSTVSRQLTEYLVAKGLPVHGFDTDPVNHTFAEHKGFNVRAVNIMEGTAINPRLYDDFFEEILMLPDEAHAVVDTGSSNFITLLEYMAQNPTLPTIRDMGGTAWLHCVITAGALKDTTDNMLAMRNYFPDTPLVVWLNPYFGEIVRGGVPFERFPEFQECTPHALVRMPDLNRATYGKDIEILLSRRQTLAEAKADPSWNIFARQRLIVYHNEMATALDKAGIC